MILSNISCFFCDYDNQDASGNVKAWEDQSSNTYNTLDELDMGYHYWAAMYDSGYDLVTGTYSITNGKYSITLRHPKEAVGSFSCTIEEELFTFYPEGASAISSSVYEGENRTIMTFYTDLVPDSEENVWHRLICYKRFRGDSDSFGIIEDLQSYEITEGHARPTRVGLTMISAAGESDGTMTGPIYLAVNVTWRGTLPDPIWVKSALRLYRYEPDPEEWILIGNQEYLTEYTGDMFYDAGIAANDNDLYVFWIREDLTTAGIYSYHCTNASRRDPGSQQYPAPDPDFVTGGDFLVSINHDLPLGIGFESMVQAEWDESIPVPEPRIIWNEYYNLKYHTWAARILLQDPMIIDYDNLFQISDENAGSSRNPSIAVNRNLLPGASPEIKVFAGFTSGDNVIRSDMRINQYGNDEWEPVIVDDENGVVSGETWITHRVFGTPQQIWKRDGKIHTNSETFEGDGYSNPENVRICTNRGEELDLDIYITYGQNYTSNLQVMIQALEP